MKNYELYNHAEYDGKATIELLKSFFPFKSKFKDKVSAESYCEITALDCDLFINDEDFEYKIRYMGKNLKDYYLYVAQYYADEINKHEKYIDWRNCCDKDFCDREMEENYLDYIKFDEDEWMQECGETQAFYNSTMEEF